jgi:hypothetical protein
MHLNPQIPTISPLYDGNGKGNSIGTDMNSVTWHRHRVLGSSARSFGIGCLVGQGRHYPKRAVLCIVISILFLNHHNVEQHPFHLQPFLFAIGAERSTPTAHARDRLVRRVPIPPNFVGDSQGECIKTKMDAKAAPF